jgi:hypothetical protein
MTINTVCMEFPGGLQVSSAGPTLLEAAQYTPLMAFPSPRPHMVAPPKNATPRHA